jgi:putative heme iron utilization protein
MNDPAPQRQGERPFDAVSSARQVMRLALTGALATLDDTGQPFASLVTTATSAAGEPVLLLSELAVHTANLKRDARASLLLVGPGGEAGDPLAGARVSLTGTVGRDDDAALRRRFLARHPEAEGYAGFSDFAFYRFSVETGHLVAGFGRIVDIMAENLLVGTQHVLEESEEGAVRHMNEDHADALRLYATALLGQPDGPWRTVGMDSHGIDLMCADTPARLDFPAPVNDAAGLRATLAALAKQARAAAA